MMHLITMTGKTAKDFYLSPTRVSDLQSVIRAVTSKRSLIISTRFRTDLFYKAEVQSHLNILKLWSMYAIADDPGIAEEDLSYCSGLENCLNQYFQSLNKLSKNVLNYRQYQSAFANAYTAYPRNPLAITVAGCDQHLIQHPDIKRGALMEVKATVAPKNERDTFEIAMGLIQDDVNPN